MKLFAKRNIETNSVAYYASYDAGVLEEMSEDILRKVTSGISEQVVKSLMPYVMKNIDKSLIVEQVSLQVSKDIIEGIFSKPERKD